MCKICNYCILAFKDLDVPCIMNSSVRVLLFQNNFPDDESILSSTLMKRSN